MLGAFAPTALMHAPAGLAHQPSPQAGARSCHGLQASSRARRSPVDVLTKQHGSLRPAAGCKRGRRSLHVRAVFEKVTRFALTSCVPSIWLDSWCPFLICCLPAVYRAGHLWGPCRPTSGRCHESGEGEQLYKCPAMPLSFCHSLDLLEESLCVGSFPASGAAIRVAHDDWRMAGKSTAADLMSQTS